MKATQQNDAAYKFIGSRWDGLGAKIAYKIGKPVWQLVSLPIKPFWFFFRTLKGAVTFFAIALVYAAIVFVGLSEMNTISKDASTSFPLFRVSASPGFIFEIVSFLVFFSGINLCDILINRLSVSKDGSQRNPLFALNSFHGAILVITTIVLVVCCAALMVNSAMSYEMSLHQKYASATGSFFSVGVVGLVKKSRKFVLCAITFFATFALASAAFFF